MKNGIGVIDSGVGGLTVAKEIMRQLPQESIYYFGDTARCPYGPRPQEEVRKFTLQMIDYLLQWKIKALVIACNTATAAVLEDVERQLPIPVIGVINPGARTAIKESKTGKIGVIGTVGTINSNAYEKALKRVHPNADVFSLACPDLVSLVESGIMQGDLADETVRRSLQPMLEHPIDTLILGCTHYPLLADVIAEVVGSNVKLISSAVETARELSTILHFQDLLNKTAGDGGPTHKIFISGMSSVVEEIAHKCFMSPLELHHVQLK